MQQEIKRLVLYSLAIVLVAISQSAWADEAYINPFVHIPAESAGAILVGRWRSDGRFDQAARITDPSIVSKVAHEIRDAKAVRTSYGTYDQITVILLDKKNQLLAGMDYVTPSNPQGFMPRKVTKKGDDFFLHDYNHYVAFGIPFNGFGELVHKYVDIYQIPDKDNPK
jgi:hypothetical protein